MKMTEEQFNALQARQQKKRPDPKAKMQALGRLKPGEMNKTERRFFDEWITPRIHSGELVWSAFELITLKIASDCRITVDFFVMRHSGEIEAIDVKGSSAVVTDDALVKLKVAADTFPFPVSMAWPKKAADGGGWEIKPVK